MVSPPIHDDYKAPLIRDDIIVSTIIVSGLIQASLSKIQGLVKDF